MALKYGAKKYKYICTRWSLNKGNFYRKALGKVYENILVDN